MRIFHNPCILSLIVILLIGSNLSLVAATFPGSNGKIAFRHDLEQDSSTSEIFVMNNDGTNATRLTFNSETDWYPAWSPDGSKIAWAASRNENWDIYVMNADGSNVIKITQNPWPDTWPSWSPDGSQIVFGSSPYVDGNPSQPRDRIFIINVDGSGQKQLTFDMDQDWYEWDPQLSPDGNKIVFTSNRPGAGGPGYSSSIFIMNSDGTDVTQLTFGPGGDRYPSFSPDGKKIAFMRYHEIYVVDIDGSNLMQLTDDAFINHEPCWSPDGSKIVFTRSGGPLEICIMNSDGSNIHQITDNNIPDMDPDWQSAPASIYAKPVSGNILTVNKLSILSHYLILAGLIIASSTVYIIKKRKDM